MRFAIRIGLGVNFILYTTSLVVLSYFSAPHIGQTWDDIVLQYVENPKLFSIYWGVGTAAVSLVLDIYILILPLPIIVKLNMSATKRVQLMAVFFTAFLGVVACTVSLVYRVKALLDVDTSWDGGVVLNCTIVEMDVAAIVASMPGFARFVRSHILESKLANSLRSILASHSSGGHSRGMRWPDNRDRNQPRTGRNDDERKRGQVVGFYGLNETWLLNSRETLDEETVTSAPTTVHSANGVRVIQAVDVDQPSKAQREGFERGLISYQRTKF
ncbi:hypothetical protein VP1G_05588 [Cytospora mali]|uniref:Rhodopsin domain-containing protein n=1 Tax=Cytospora mali TaxID=578113 RepID=A0A194V351_CYTMA|nr:hypothetical protein VP1G_05588 [Valsa mali var. pyri (nom. inval.)]